MWSASPHFFLSTFLLTLFLPSLSLPLPFSLSILYFTEFHLSPYFSSLCEHTLYFPFFQSVFHPHTIFIFILNLCLWIKSACIQPSTRFKPVGLVQTRLTLWSWWLKITNPLHFFYCCEQTQSFCSFMWRNSCLHHPCPESSLWANQFHSLLRYRYLLLKHFNGNFSSHL